MEFKKNSYIGVIFQSIRDSLDWCEELIEDNEEEFMLKESLELTESFFTIRFESEYKQYNYDEDAMNDSFIVERNLNLFNIYIEQLMLLDVEITESNETKLLTKRKNMRQILHTLWHAVNEFKH